jgi:hypothetical protein
MATWDGYNQSIIANRFQKSFMVNYVDLSGRLLVRQDASFNNRLFVMNDASFAGNVYVDDILTTNLKFDYSRDASYNKRLFVQNDASFMGNVYVDDNLTTNLKMISIGDTSLNSNVVVGRDISCNGNINIGRNITVLGNIAIKNYTATNVINTTTTNYSLAVVEDISLNGRVSVSSDTSLNGNLFVSRDISLNGNVNGTVNFMNDISVNGMTIGRKALVSTVYCGNLVSTNDHINTTLFGYKSFTIKQNTAQAAIGLGFQTGLSVTTGGYNTAIGSRSLNTTTTGGFNVGIGYNSGIDNAGGSFNTCIGYGTVNGSSGAVRDNTTVIGADNTMGGSNRFTLGTISQTVIIPRIERFLTPPMMIRTISSAVSFTTGPDTVILWDTLNYAGSNVAVSYNTSTGVFSNVESHTIGVSVSASFAFAANPNYNRALWVKHSNAAYSRVGHMEMQASHVDVTALNVSANFTLNSSESFTILGWQNSGATLTASSAFNGVHPCRVMITTY